MKSQKILTFAVVFLSAVWLLNLFTQIREPTAEAGPKKMKTSGTGTLFSPSSS